MYLSFYIAAFRITFRTLNKSAACTYDYSEEVKLLKALTHPARLAILEILRDGEQCVCHMEAILQQRQAYISQ